jgi:RHS repeat-associated protein
MDANRQGRCLNGCARTVSGCGLGTDQSAAGTQPPDKQNRRSNSRSGRSRGVGLTTLITFAATFGIGSGGIDGDDIEAFMAVWATGSEPSSGVCRATLVRFGYAGYEWDGTVCANREYTGAAGGVYHVRNRVYDPEMGRWTRRDPAGYVDGSSLYAYVACRALNAVDPGGFAQRPCSTDFNSSYCKKACKDNAPVNGINPSGEFPPICCVCTANIDSYLQRYYPYATWEFDFIFTDCIEVHEQTHRDTFGASTYCTECSAYQAELGCLQSHKSSCATASCREAIDDHIKREIMPAISDYCTDGCPSMGDCKFGLPCKWWVSDARHKAD